ncbi:MAG: hypothetical protein ACR2IH_11755 [Pyrinomonadaceae bacterium]
MKTITAHLKKVIVILLAVAAVFVSATDVSAQRKRKRPAKPAPVYPTIQPQGEPLIISRAEDFPDENGAVPVPAQTTNASLSADSSGRSIEDLRARLTLLESSKSKDSNQKQKNLLLYLDILTKAEQRGESLRKQEFEMIEKEGSIKSRLDGIEIDIRPESIEKNVALAGSLRPEELRDARQRSLAAERANLQNLLIQVQRIRASLELNLAKADDLVDRMRSRLEKDIDDALADDPGKKP